MKTAKFIISLQVLFLAATIIFSTGIAYNSAQQGALPAVTATNLALRLPYEVADPARNQFQAQLAAMDSMQRALETVSQGHVPEGATKIAGLQGAFLVPFTVDAQRGAPQAKESALVVMSTAAIEGLQLDGALSGLRQGVNVYLPPAGSIQDAINAASKSSSAGSSIRNVPVTGSFSGVYRLTGHRVQDAVEKLKAGELLIDAKRINIPGADRLLLVPVIGQRDGTAFLAMSTHDQTREIAAAVQKDDDLSRKYGIFIGRPLTHVIESILKASSSGLVIPMITPEQASRAIEDARQNLGVIGQGIIPGKSSLGTFRFEFPVFQKRDIAQVNPVTGQPERVIIGALTPDGIPLAPETPLHLVTAKDSVRQFADLSKVMGNPDAITSSAQKDEIAYYMLRGLFASPVDMTYAFDEQGMRFDITAMIPAMVDGELVHTSGHYHNPLIKPEIYQVVSGTAIYLLQQHQMPADWEKLPKDEFKRRLAEAPVVKSVAIVAKPGQPVVIPAGWGHVTVNPSLTEPLIMANWLTHNQESAYGPYETFHGPAYRITIGENNDIGVMPNDEYVEGIPFMFATPMDVEYLRLVTGEPIYDIVKDPSAFQELSWFLETGAVSDILGLGELSVIEIGTEKAAELLEVAKVSVDIPKTSSAGLAKEVEEALTQLAAKPDMNTLENVHRMLQAAYTQYTTSAQPEIRQSVDIALKAIESLSIHQRAQESVLARAQDVSARPASQTQPVLTVYHDIGSMPSTLKADAIRSLGTQHFRVETLDVNTIPNDLKPENSIIITANLEVMQAALEQAGKEKTKILPISQLEHGQFVPFVQLTQQAKDILLLSIPGSVSDNIVPTIKNRIGNTHHLLTGKFIGDIDEYIKNPASYIISILDAVAPVYESGQLEALYNMIIQAAQAA